MPFEMVPPAAHALAEAMRGLGYTLWTAIADIIDNSIAAGAYWAGGGPAGSAEPQSPDLDTSDR